jgi:hypothetical protein
LWYNDGLNEQKMVRGHVSSAVECENFDDKTSSDTKEISGNVALLDRCQAPLKVTIFSLKAQELRDSGGVDPQDPCVTFKLGSNFYRTKRFFRYGTIPTFAHHQQQPFLQTKGRWNKRILPRKVYIRNRPCPDKYFKLLRGYLT